MRAAMRELREYLASMGIDWETVNVNIEFKDPDDEYHFKNQIRVDAGPLRVDETVFKNQMEGMHFSLTNRWKRTNAFGMMESALRELKRNA